MPSEEASKSDITSEKANQLLEQKYGVQGKLIRLINKIRRTRPIVLSIQIQT